MTNTEDEENIINCPDEPTYPDEKSVSRSGATPLHGVGVELDGSKLAANQATARGQKEPFLHTQELLGTQFAAIRDKYGLSDSEAADSAAAATAVLIKNCSTLLDPHVGFGLAVYGFIEGSKTAPAESGST